MLKQFLKLLTVLLILSAYVPVPGTGTFHCYGQAGFVNVRGIIVQEPGNPLRSTTINDNVIQSKQISLIDQDGEGPTLQFTAPDADDDLFLITDGSESMIEMGWVAGASNFGKIRVGSDLDPADASTIEGAGLTARTIVLRNLAGFTAAIHLEETGGGTDTVQIRGPASTAGGLFFVIPGTDGTAGQCLSTNGSGVLSWAGCAGGTGSSAGATGDVQFSADGAGTFGADAAFNWENTAKELRLGTAPPTGFTLNVDGEIALNNSDGIYWEDGGGTARQVILASGGNVVLGHIAAPSAGGDTTISSAVSTTEVGIKLEARGDNVAVWQPQLIVDGASTNAYYLGDNDNPYTGYIGLGANLIGFGGSPAQLLIEEQVATSGGGVGDFITILGGANMLAGYVIGLPDDTPAVGEFLKVASQDGSVWNLEWAAGAGGGSGCVPTGASGEIQYSDGAGACLDDSSFVFDSDLELGVGTSTPNTRIHAVSNAAADTNILRLQYRGTIGDRGSIIFSNTATSTLARIGAHTSTGSTVDIVFDVFGGSQLKMTSTGNFQLDNAKAILFEDGAGTARNVLSSSSGQVVLGHVVAPSAGGDTFVASFTGTTETALRFQARNDNVFVLQPQFTADGSSTSRYFLGDNDRYWEAYIGIGANLLTRAGTPAQLLIQDENSSGFTTILGAPGTMVSYAMRLPSAAPTASQVLAATTFSGGAWNTAWTTLGGGGFICNTAGNCFNLTDAQTAAGNKTFTGTTTARTILPQATNAYALGSTSFKWQALYSNFYDCGTASSVSCTFNIYHSGEAGFSRINSQNLTGSTDIEFQMDVGAAVYPGSSNFTDLGLATRKWQRIYAGTAFVGPSGTNGTSATLTCGAGQAVKNITVSGGVVTSVSCGAP